MSSIMLFTEIACLRAYTHRQARLLFGESVSPGNLNEREKRILTLVENGFENRIRLTLIDLIALSETLRIERIKRNYIIARRSCKMT